jgi:Tfp pilus assembly protein PilF
LLVLAHTLQVKGVLAQAEHSYRQVLKHLPDLAAAHNDLGTVCAARALR